MADYLPSTDEALEAFGINFKDLITATPTVYGVTAADATAYAALLTDYSTRLETATQPNTRTVVTIGEKEISRAALVAKTRALAKIINAFPGTTNPMRQSLGLNPRDVEPTPVPAPTTRPQVTVSSTGVLRLVDEASPTRRAKPAGVIGAHIYMKLAEASAPAPTTRAETEYMGLVTRTINVPVALPEGSAGKKLWILAQWVNEKGESGPISAVAGSLIAA